MQYYPSAANENPNQVKPVQPRCQPEGILSERRVLSQWRLQASDVQDKDPHRSCEGKQERGEGRGLGQS